MIGNISVRLFAGIANKLKQKGISMLSWTLTFLVIAIIAAALGFTGIAGAAANIAQIIFFIFLALLIISLLAGALRGKPPAA